MALERSAERSRGAIGPRVAGHHRLGWIKSELGEVGDRSLEHRRGCGRALLICRELEAERQSGLISDRELELAPRFFKRTRYYRERLREGRAHDTRTPARLYGDLADLAFAKRRHARRGARDVELRRRRARIRRLREELEAR